MNRIIRLLITSGAVLLLSTCEYLFYSPAFMPAVSNTTLNITSSTDISDFQYNENYNGEIIADNGSTNILAGAGDVLTFYSPNVNQSVNISALDAVAVGGETWQGVADFLGAFFQNGISITSYTTTNYPGNLFHGFIDYDYDYTANTVLDYDLPYAAPLGINENDRTTTLHGTVTYPLAVVKIHVTSSYEELAGDAIFIFGGENNYGLLYMIYEHNNGITTVIYQEQINASTVLGQYLCLGSFEYVINCFNR